MSESHKMAAPDVRDGWMQVNNTVIPQVRRYLRDKTLLRLVPLSVIQHGAGLLKDHHDFDKYKAKYIEVQTLNKMCKDATIDFNFESDLELITLTHLEEKLEGCVFISKLHDDNDPISQSEFVYGLPWLHPELGADMDTPQKVTPLLLATGSRRKGGSPRRLFRRKISGSRYSVYRSPWQRATAKNLHRIPEVEDHLEQSDLDQPLDLSRKSEEKSPFEPVKTASLSITADESLSCAVEIAPITHHQSMATKMEIQIPHKTIHKATATAGILIRPVRLFNRTIPCLVKRGEVLVLAETLRRAYFPRCSLRAFLYIIQRSVGCTMSSLNFQDIQCILKVVRNPTSLQRCRKVIRLSEVEAIFPVIEGMLLRVAKYRQGKSYDHQAKMVTNQQNEESSVVVIA